MAEKKRDDFIPQSILDEREARRRKVHVEQMSAPSYWSSFSGWQWLGAGALLLVIIVIGLAIN